MESLPEVFPIDDEYSVYSKSLDFAVVRPFDMVRSQTVITIFGHYFRDDTEKPSISAGHSSIFTSIRI